MKSNNKKEYPFDSINTFTNIQLSFLKKINGNRGSPFKQYRKGEEKLFKGWSEQMWSGVFEVALEIDQPSQDQIIERVVKPLKAIADNTNISAIFAAEKDFPPHVTLHISSFKNMTQEQQDLILSWLQSDESGIEALLLPLIGLEFDLNTLVIGSNSYLCAREFEGNQEDVFNIRKQLERIWARSVETLGREQKIAIEGSFKPPYSFDNIFHSSILRITEPIGLDQFRRFAGLAYYYLQEELNLNPLSIKVESVYQGIALPFFQKYVSHLLF